MKRKCMMTAALAAAALALSGCGMVMDYTIDDNGNPKVEGYMCYTEEEALQSGSRVEELAEYDTLVYNGETYYKTPTDDGDSAETGIQNTYYDTYTGTSFYVFSKEDTVDATGSADTGDDSSSWAFATYNVEMTDDIILTNGEVQADGRTVVFDALHNTTLYAYTAGSDDIIRIREMYDSKWSTSKTIHIDTMDKVKSVKVDGKTVKASTTDTGLSVILKNGKHKISVTTKYAKKTFTVKVDSKKPEVSVKSGKIYKKPTVTFSDSGSGIKEATLNGEAFTSGTKITKSGDYTLKVTDKAGNTKTVKFSVQ